MIGGRAVRALSVVLVVVILGACRPAELRALPPPTASPAPVSSVVIGTLLDLGEGDSEDRRAFEGVSLAVDDLNSRGGIEVAGGQRTRVRLAAYDVSGGTDRIETALRRLVAEDGAVAVIGPEGRDATIVARRLAERMEVPLLALSATPDVSSSRWSFLLAAGDDAPVSALVDFLRASGVERIGWLAPRTTAATDVRASMRRLVEASGAQVTGEEIYPPGATDLSPRSARLVEAGAQAILAWPGDARGAAALVTQIGTRPERASIFLGPAASDPKTLGLVGDGGDGLHAVMSRLGVADDLWDHDSLTPLIRDFDRAYRLRYGALPDDRSAAAWDAVQVLARALSQGQASRASVRTNLERITDLSGVSGPITFSSSQHQGLDHRAFVVARAAGGRWRLPP